MTKVAIYSLLVVLVCLVPQLNAKQSKKAPDIRLANDKPTVYVSFVRSGPRRPLENWESDQGVWLRVYNNTKWNLIFNAGGVPDPSYGDAVIFYNIKRIEGEGAVPIGYQRHVSSVIQLQSGRSLEFSIPREHVSQGLAIEIAFNYAWELNKEHTTVRESEPLHYITFESSLVR